MRKYKYQDMTLNDPVGALLFLQQHVSQVGDILNKRLFNTNIKENLWAGSKIQFKIHELLAHSSRQDGPSSDSPHPPPPPHPKTLQVVNHANKDEEAEFQSLVGSVFGDRYCKWVTDILGPAFFSSWTFVWYSQSVRTNVYAKHSVQPDQEYTDQTRTGLE